MNDIYISILSSPTTKLNEIKDFKDNKGRSPYLLANEKKNQEIIKLFTENIKCQLCALKGPIAKMEKSSFNVIFFVLKSKMRIIKN